MTGKKISVLKYSRYIKKYILEGILGHYTTTDIMKH